MTHDLIPSEHPGGWGWGLGVGGSARVSDDGAAASEVAEAAARRVARAPIGPRPRLAGIHLLEHGLVPTLQ
eukprot:7154020-Prymnesium_polylepis.1